MEEETREDAEIAEQMRRADRAAGWKPESTEGY